MFEEELPKFWMWVFLIGFISGLLGFVEYFLYA